MQRFMQIPARFRITQHLLKIMIRRRIFHFAILLVMSLGFAGQADAKREAPPKLEPIKFGDDVFAPSGEKCGRVVKTNRKTGKVVREIQFYRVSYDPELEKDVQDVWFTDFFRVGDDIWARDEKGRIYKMLLKTLKPSRNRHTTQEEFDKLKKSAAS